MPEHSGRAGGWVAAQTTWRGRRVLFAVGDAGRGIRESLRTRVDVGTDASALDLVLQGATRYDEPGRGRGILETHRLVTKLAGSVTLVSGRAATVAQARSSCTRSGPHPWPGTLFQGELRTA